ncbi:MAG: STAS domain-containing protein [Planctomycetaceae bacterium]
MANLQFIAISGDFDEASIARHGKKVEAALQAGTRKIVLNLKGVRFVDSSALGFLVETQRKLKEGGGGLAVSEPSKFVRGVIASLGLDRVFGVFANDEEARSRLEGP